MGFKSPSIPPLGGSARFTVQIAGVSLASYLCGSYVTGYFHSASAETGGLWAIMSGLVVLQQTRHQTLALAWHQVSGTLVGALIAAAYLSSLPFSAIGMGLSIFAATLLCHALKMSAQARLAALAVGVVMVISSLHPTLHPVLSAVLRFTEACMGAAMAVLATLLWPEPASATKIG